MIFTRFGSEVEIVRSYPKSDAVDVRQIKDNRILYTRICELKADGGLIEI